VCNKSHFVSLFYLLYISGYFRDFFIQTVRVGINFAKAVKQEKIAEKKYIHQYVKKILALGTHF
jgi:hypothetical protein